MRSFFSIVTAVIMLGLVTKAAAEPEYHQLEGLMALNEQIKYDKPAELLESKLITVRGADLPWVNTGLKLKKGQFVTFLLDGKLDYGADIIIEPGVAFWAGFGRKKPKFTQGKTHLL